MPDSHADEAERRTDAKHDNWPIEDQDAWADWPVERRTPRDEGGTLEEVVEEREEEVDYDWVGVGGAGTGTAYVYDGTTVRAGDIDAENERIILREDDRDDDSGASLGERIESIGEERGWSWLSSFARDHLQSDERRVHGSGGTELRDSEFDRRSVVDADPYDLSFTGRHAFVDESGRRHVLNREFDVYVDDDRAGAGRAFVEVHEDHLVAETTDEETVEDDAEIVEERTREFEVETDTERRLWENDVEGTLREWHRSHVGGASTDD